MPSFGRSTAAEPGPGAIEDTDCVVVYNVDRTEAAVGRGGRESYYKERVIK
jgi:hypothetical protein